MTVRIRADQVQAGDVFIPTALDPVARAASLQMAIARGAGEIAKRSLYATARLYRRRMTWVILVMTQATDYLTPILRADYTLITPASDTDLLPETPACDAVGLSFLNTPDHHALGVFCRTDTDIATIKHWQQLLNPTHVILHPEQAYRVKRAWLQPPTPPVSNRVIIMAPNDIDYDRLLVRATQYNDTIISYEASSDQADRVTIAYRIGEHLGLSTSTIAMGLLS